MIPHFTVYFCEYCNVLVAVLTALDSADFPGNFDIKIVKIDGHLREKSPSEGTNYQAEIPPHSRFVYANDRCSHVTRSIKMQRTDDSDSSFTRTMHRFLPYIKPHRVFSSSGRRPDELV